MEMTENGAVESTLRVRYAETDAMGVVYHANYLVWFEVGRGDWFRALGQDYGKWEEEGYLLPVSEAYARYHAPAQYGDEVTVRTRLGEAKSRTVTMRYQVLSKKTGERLVAGWTKHVCADRSGRMRRLPAQMQQALEAHAQDRGS
jgi:acyl-CoA thioester hydrolase